MVNGWVVDCSFAMAWALPDEKSKQADDFSGFVEADVIWVPALFWYEVANVLAMSRRRGRLTESSYMEVASVFSQMPIRTDAQFSSTAFLSYGSLACDRGISAYDAAYLELAFRRGFGLATLDKKLARLARKGGGQVWPEK